jgi:hypothetical protein
MLAIQIIGCVGLIVVWTWAWLVIVQHFDPTNKENKS